MFKLAKPESAIAIRTIDLRQGLRPVDDVSAYEAVYLFVMDGPHLLGRVYFRNNGASIGHAELLDAITEEVGPKIYGALSLVGRDRYEQAHLSIERHLSVRTGSKSSDLYPGISSVTVLVATRDRPDDLRRCLSSVERVCFPVPIEVVVVDNNPASGLTPPVVADFEGVRLVSEARQGVAYARNAGIAASTGDVITTTDDDVVVPSDWLVKLLKPFRDPKVMAVTGNVLPAELESPSQILYEEYGGLCRGFERWVADEGWFRGFRKGCVPTWALGATANAAFRAELFGDRRIGLLDEALGPGMPSGVCEDIYLFYKILKAGHSIAYEPDAYVWHRHRTSMAALKKQLYNYSKGQVSYQLTTLTKDGDWRALPQLLYWLPGYVLRRIVGRLRGAHPYPLPLVLTEIWGNLAGPFGLYRSRRRVKRWGRVTLGPG